MSSSNKHWPSMFKSKSKPCNNQNQYHHLVSSSSSHITSAAVERCPEPKSRWNPKAEQIRILEALFNSGMVNPPRDEIRRIRIQLQEFGQVGDANVFYWFQNRKSRTKQKLRHQIPSPSKTNNTSAAAVIATPSPPPGPTGSPGFFQPASQQQQQQRKNEPRNLIMPTPSFSPVQQIISTDSNVFGAGFGFPDVSSFTSLGQMSGIVPSSTSSSAVTTFPSSFHHINHLLGGNDQDHTSLSDMITLPEYNIEDGFGLVQPEEKCTVYINDVAFEVAVAPLNVREAFGEDAALYFPSGQLVLMNQWGVTLESLQHGCHYYLMRTFSSTDDAAAAAAAAAAGSIYP